MSEATPAAPAAPGGALPRWASPYLPRFREILHALSLIEGFALMPVDVPSEDVARALAAWLTAEGQPVTIIEPSTEEAWRGLTPALFQAQPGAEGVVMVLGSRGEPPGMMWGLGLLNQRRDSMGKHLGRPLLWCGPWSFLDATWRAAPDLWSVADVPKRLEAPGRAPPPYPFEWTGGEVPQGLLDKLAEVLSIPRRQVLDREPRPPLTTTVTLLISHILIDAHRSYFSTAINRDVPPSGAVRERLPDLLVVMNNQAIEQAQDKDTALVLVTALWLAGLGVNRSSTELLNAWDPLATSALTNRMRGVALAVKAQILACSGQYELARIPCEEAIPVLRSTQDTFSEAHALRVLGYVHGFEGRLVEAEGAYDAALALFRRLGLRRGEAHVLRGLGDLRLVTDRLTDARQLYERALALYREIGDRLGEANAQRSLGDLFFLLEDLDAADTAFREALRIYREIGILEGERVIPHRLAEVAREKALRPGA